MNALLTGILAVLIGAGTIVLIVGLAMIPAWLVLTCVNLLLGYTLVQVTWITCFAMAILLIIVCNIFKK